MTYEERIKSMGLKPFEKYGFLYHADVSNKSRKESLERIDKYSAIIEHKVSDKKGIKLYNPSKTEVDYFEPLLILAEDDETYYVFNGIYTYDLKKETYSKYEVYDKDFDYSNEDGFI